MRRRSDSTCALRSQLRAFRYAGYSLVRLSQSSVTLSARVFFCPRQCASTKGRRSAVGRSFAVDVRFLLLCWRCTAEINSLEETGVFKQDTRKVVSFAEIPCRAQKRSSTNLWGGEADEKAEGQLACLLYTSPSPRDGLLAPMPSSA